MYPVEGKKNVVKLNNSDYKYQNAEDAGRGRVMDKGDKKYSAFANPKDRTVYMAGCKSVGDKNMKGKY